MARHIFVVFSMFLVMVFCSGRNTGKKVFSGAPGEIRLITLDPGHFHAALVQKSMYKQVSPEVFVYAPEGTDVEEHLNRIRNYNSRTDNPTSWEEKVTLGTDFLDKMIREKPGNVVVISGNNRKKTENIKAAVDAGLQVLADKPMCIDRDGFLLLKEAFASAEKKGVLLYDIMTERHEITTILQKELSRIPDVFGELVKGTPDDPSVVKESVHHFFKYVSGNPLRRPPWYFDVTQQGEGIVDVSTHLVDLVQWECFPDVVIDYTADIRMLHARRWPTLITLEQFGRSTGLSDFPEYLMGIVKNGVLPVYANGEMIYTIRGVHAKVSVIWNFEPPEGGGDTHYSIMKGTKANVIILQGKEQKYRPELYVEPAAGQDPETFGNTLMKAMTKVAEKYPDVSMEKQGKRWHVIIPDRYRVGHEAHFAQVTEKYLDYLVKGQLPAWEVPNMLTKYQTTTSALEMAKSN